MVSFPSVEHGAYEEEIFVADKQITVGIIVTEQIKNQNQTKTPREKNN